jgi:hypothetical protein
LIIINLHAERVTRLKRGWTLLGVFVMSLRQKQFRYYSNPVRYYSNPVVTCSNEGLIMLGNGKFDSLKPTDADDFLILEVVFRYIITYCSRFTDMVLACKDITLSRLLLGFTQ